MRREARLFPPNVLGTAGVDSATNVDIEKGRTSVQTATFI